MEQRVCVQCGKSFSIERISCPYCGYLFPAFEKKVGKVQKKFSYYAMICFSLGMAAGIFAGISEAIIVAPSYLPLVEPPSSVMYLLMVVIIAPVVEEPTKILGLYILHFTEDTKFEMRKWVLFGVFGGLGFALLENLLYVGTASIDYGGSAAGLVLVLRTLLSLPFHLIASGVAAYGFGRFVDTKKLRYFFMFLALAMLIHGLFNLAASYV